MPIATAIPGTMGGIRSLIARDAWLLGPARAATPRPGRKALLRIATLEHPVACNRATADMMTAPLMTSDYERQTPDYATHIDWRPAEGVRQCKPNILVASCVGCLSSVVRAGSRTCGDVWFRQGLATGEREPRTPLGLVNQVAKRSTWQPPVDSRSRCLGSRVSVEAASASRVVEASFSGAAIRTSVT